MKKLILPLIGILWAFDSDGQTGSLKHFVGMYTFSDSSAVPSVDITISGKGLFLSSDAGNFPLIMQRSDSFRIAELKGLVVFKRGKNKEVNGIYIDAAGYVLDGTKENLKVVHSAQIRLWDAAINGDTTEIVLAIRDNANINLIDTRQSESGRFSLNWAALFNHPEAIRILLKYGSSIDTVNITGNTALHHAAESGSLEAARVLLEEGANLNVTNKSGMTPVEIARKKKHRNIVDLLESSK